MDEKITSKKTKEKPDLNKFPTLKLKTERDIAMDFATKVYRKFDKLIKSVILFGSAAKNTQTAGSDIDIILLVDDATIRFDDRLIVWYREELGKIMQSNPYKKDLHVNTVKLTTWWQDITKGDPTIINVIRYGETLIDFGGFFNPLKILLEEGKIKPTPESIHASLNRVPYHLIRSKQAEISAIEGCFWAMVDSAQSLLMAINLLPPSYDHIAIMLNEHLVNKKLLNKKYVRDFQELYKLHKSITHGEVKDISGNIIDYWQKQAEEFFEVTMKLIKEIV